MENNVNFDELAQKFLAARGEETYCNLFGAVFELEQWQFIAVGEPPNFSPYCAVFPGFMEDQPTVLAFTDTERLNKYVKSKNLKFGSADQPVVITSSQATVTFSSEDLILGVPTTNVVNFLERLMTEKGVKWLVFNQDKNSTGFQLELARLRETRELVDSKKPKIKAESKAEQVNKSPVQTDFDALNRKSNQSGGARSDLDNLFGATFALEKWLFIARGELPNVNPYIAANAEYADGQQMIRAFTDANRLQRFAKENNLTDANGSAQMLEIPTSGAVEYLEQFIQYGAHGVWFNSDTESDGYFIPLKQLRPIKEHLVNIGWKSIEEPTNPELPHNTGFVAPANAGQAKGRRAPLETVVINVKHGLMMASGFVKEADYFCDCFCRVAPEWIDGGDVTEAARQKLFETLFGKNWQAGNSDGSRYVVRRLNWKVFTPERARGFGWDVMVDNDESHFLFFIADENDELKKVSREQFVTDINSSAANFAAAPTANNSPAQPTEQVENVGDFDGYISWLRSGAIKFDQTFKPFFPALKPLLESCAGAGKFTFAFAGGMDEPGMKDLFEDETSGASGASLKYRSCIYERGGKTEDLQVIGSNLLTNTQTGEKLRVQLTLRKDLAAQTAKLIVILLGTAAEVEKLGAAIQPALDDGEFAKQLEIKKPRSPSEAAAELVG